MSDKLIKMDYERGKVILMRTFTGEDGSTYEKMIEMDLPQPPMSEGKLRKVKRGADGRMYETEEIVRFPMPQNRNLKEEQ